MDNMAKRKKLDAVLFRMFPETKAAFKEVCDIEEISMSQKLFDFVEAEIARHGVKVKRKRD